MSIHVFRMNLGGELRMNENWLKRGLLLGMMSILLFSSLAVAAPQQNGVTLPAPGYKETGGLQKAAVFECVYKPGTADATIWHVSYTLQDAGSSQQFWYMVNNYYRFLIDAGVIREGAIGQYKAADLDAAFTDHFLELCQKNAPAGVVLNQYWDKIKQAYQEAAMKRKELQEQELKKAYEQVQAYYEKVIKPAATKAYASTKKQFSDWWADFKAKRAQWSAIEKKVDTAAQAVRKRITDDNLFTLKQKLEQSKRLDTIESLVLTELSKEQLETLTDAQLQEGFVSVLGNEFFVPGQWAFVNRQLISYTFNYGLPIARK